MIHIHRADEFFGGQGFRDPEVGNLLRALVEQLPQVRVILESVKQPPSGLFSDRLYEERRVRGLDATAVQRYFRQPFRPADRRGWDLDGQAAEDLHGRLGGRDSKTGAHPLGMALLASVADGLSRDPLAVARRYPPEFYRSFEERLFTDLYEHVLTEPQRHMLRLCALYRQPIPDGHAEILNERVKDDHAFDALVQRLLLSPDEAQSHYQLHSLFADLARQRIGEGFEVQADHARIADAWLRQVSRRRRSSLPNILAANEAAHHLLEAEEFHRLQELSENLLGHDTPARLEEWGIRLYESKRFDDHYCVLELLLKLSPGDHKAHRFFGEAIERREGRGSTRALEHYLKAFELHPTFPPYLANIGRNLQRRDPGRFVTLVDSLAEPARSRAVNDYVRSVYTACLEQAGRGYDASTERQRLIQAGSHNPTFYNDEVLWLKKQGDLEGALKILELAELRAIAEDHTLAIKAKLLEELDRGEEAFDLRRARIEQGSRNPFFYNDQALWLSGQGDRDGALEILELAEQRAIANDHTIAITAKLLEELDRGADAFELRRTRIEQGSRDPFFYNDQALWLRDQGRVDESLRMLELARKHRCTNEYTENIRRSVEQRARRQPSSAEGPLVVSRPSPHFNADRTHTILVLAANPLLDLRLDEEIRTMQQGLERARERERFAIETRPAARIADLRRALLDLHPAILHFSGHGKGGPGILLQGPDDQAVSVAGGALRNLFGLFKENLSCVVLNACYSAVQAEAIAEHIPCVIGMSEAIGDEAARLFSEGFYDGLGAGKDIEIAWRLGCNALELQGIPEQHIPVLIRDGKRMIYGQINAPENN